MRIRGATYRTVGRVVRLFSSLAFVVAAALSVAAAWPGVATARTWHVTADKLGDAPTVQAAIDSASVGDVVLVGPGTYRERINFLGKDITVRSESGPEATVLDGENRPGAVVVMSSGEGRGAVLEGFTVTRGTGELFGSSRRGGGLYIISSSPRILGNVIKLNSASLWGGGIYVDGTATEGVLIEGNVIEGNVAAGNGGGIGLLTRGDVINNQILDNECEDGDGGGLWLWTFDAFDYHVESNLILRNRAGDHGGGVHVALNDGLATATIALNLIAHNQADGSEQSTRPGGGIYLGRGDQTVRRNTIAFNEARFGASAAAGGGIAIIYEGSKLVEQNIITHTLFGGGIYCDPGLAPTIQNNLAWDNVGGDGVGDCAGWEQTSGNVVADPQLCDPGAGDYTVAKLSPALSHPAGPLGAFPDPGCDETPVERTSWGRLKQLYD